RGGFVGTGTDSGQTAVRPKDLFDNAVPSGNSSASDLLLRLAALSGDASLEHAANGFHRLIAPALEQAPGGFGNALSALDRALGGSIEIALVGDSEELTQAAWRPYVPNRVLASGPEGSTGPPLLKGRTLVQGKPAAYV